MISELLAFCAVAAVLTITPGADMALVTRNALVAGAGAASATAAGDGGPRAALTAAQAFRQGLLTNLLNPKIAVLYATLLPQFISPGDPVLALSLLMAGIHGAMGLLWLSLYARVILAAEDVLRRPRVRATLDAITGTILVLLGVRLAVDRR